MKMRRTLRAAIKTLKMTGISSSKGSFSESNLRWAEDIGEERILPDIQREWAGLSGQTDTSTLPGCGAPRICTGQEGWIRILAPTR